jgi:dihydrofolate reductase
MSRLVFHISMSLDGFITGPNPRPDAPLGDGGERLHDWMSGITDLRESHRTPSRAADADAQVIDDAYSGIGALVMGRSMFDDGEDPWGENPPFGMPVFIVTHHARETIIKQGGTTYTFVTDGIDAALERARVAAGDQDVAIAGGADLFQQYLRAGLVDEFQIHLVPLLLGDGVRLLEHLGTLTVELEPTGVVESPSGVTHLSFRVVG